MTIEILPMCSEHVEQVWQIEQQAHSHPWAESLVRDLSSRGAGKHVMVEDSSVVGDYYEQN
ncbi:ribosomal-protein-alanine N-acetyltransferase, partial [Vibrio alginolyticus]|nr:ribosomal-protein-alanine N-acetyltransferase [Vibrio alginolyticus]MDW2199557.1 ribosomal-protein-alanine N-acetyltransferase [Vibrio sp. 2084]